jgi:UDP-2,3-diacylglucosamine pyrophosphatase LpxH
MTSRADYKIIKSNDDAVWIIDELVDGYEGDALSITNDAEEVIAELRPLYGNRRVFYRDTQGRWDELVHDETGFISFRLIGKDTPPGLGD